MRHLIFSSTTERLLDRARARQAKAELRACQPFMLASFLSPTLAIEMARQFPSLKEKTRRSGETAEHYGRRCARRRMLVAWAACMLLADGRYGSRRAWHAVRQAKLFLDDFDDGTHATVEQLVETARWTFEPSR